MFVGDGSYLMMNSDLYSSVLSGHKLIVIVCDNGGFAVINRLQVNQGGVPFNNLFEDTDVTRARRRRLRRPRRGDGLRRRDASTTVAELEAAFERARRSDRTTVIAMHDRRVHVDRGRRVLGGRRARGQRPRRGAGGEGGDGRRTSNSRGSEHDGDGKLDGKVVVVSGGTQGLGEAIARQVVADGAAGLVIAGRSADRGEALAAELTGLGHTDDVRRGRHGDAGGAASR